MAHDSMSAISQRRSGMPDAAPPSLVPSNWGYTAVAPGAIGVAAHALCGLGQRTWPHVGWLCLPGCPRFSFRHGLAPYAGGSVPGRPLRPLAEPDIQGFLKMRTPKDCANNRHPELAGRYARNAQWITPNG